MLYLVFARDRASQTILKRKTREAAELREARSLTFRSRRTQQRRPREHLHTRLSLPGEYLERRHLLQLVCTRCNDDPA